MIAEFDAVRALLHARPLLATRVRDSAVNDKGEVVRDNYVVLFGAGPGELDDDRYGSIPRPESDAVYELPGKAVGTDPEAVRLVLSEVKAIVGVKPAITGRRADPVTVEFENVKVDNSVSPPMYFSDFWVRFGSRRA